MAIIVENVSWSIYVAFIKGKTGFSEFAFFHGNLVEFFLPISFLTLKMCHNFIKREKVTFAKAGRTY